MISVLAAAIAAPTRTALVLGVSAYRDSGLEVGVERVESDSLAVQALLAEAGFQVVPLRGAVHREELLGAVRRALLEVGSEDDFVLYFAGHAVSGVGGWSNLWLLPWEADPDSPQDAAIRLGEVLELIHARGPRNVFLVLDACRTPARAAPRRVDDAALTTSADLGTVAADQTRGSWTVVLAASRGQAALEGPTHGVFTQALLDGATRDGTLMQADLDGSGGLTAVEWALFAARQTDEASGGGQVPDVHTNVRGKGSFVVLGNDSSSARALLFASGATWIEARGAMRGRGVAVEPGVVPVVVGSADARPSRTLLAVRAGDEVQADLLLPRAASLWLGGGITQTGGELTRPVAFGLAGDLALRDVVWSRPVVGLRLDVGALGSTERWTPNVTTLGTLGAGWGPAWIAPGGVDSVAIGPLIGAGALLRWPEAWPGGLPVTDSTFQAGFAGYAAGMIRVELGRVAVLAEAGALLPLVDGALAPEARLSIGARIRIGDR